MVSQPRSNVASKTFAQLEVADPNGDAVERGAAAYFAQGCQSCHGQVGDAPGNLGLRGGGRDRVTIRRAVGRACRRTGRIESVMLNWRTFRLICERLLDREVVGLVENASKVVVRAGNQALHPQLRRRQEARNPLH